MMFRASVLALLSASSVRADPLAPPCYDNYASEFSLALDSNQCSSRKVFKALVSKFKANRTAVRKRCRGGAGGEIMKLTGTTTLGQAREKVHQLCAAALNEGSDQLGTETWDALSDVHNLRLDDFFDGGTFLNLETGNFQQSARAFTRQRGSADKFIYAGTDPTKNDHYPTTKESFEVGEAIKDMKDLSERHYLTAPTDGFECDSNTAMCCWHRDRQYFDQNGNCNLRDCANQNPGDNTDLCWTEHEGNVFPYPGDDTEKDLHCHGFAWSNAKEDKDGNEAHDINTKAKFNNLFYVSAYDHMYKRGYVESITNDPKIEGEQPMCGCVEDMNPVARADCTEVTGAANYTATVVEHGDGTQSLAIAPVPGTFRLEFRACQGYDYVDDFEPSDLPGNRGDLRASNNDLSAFVFRQYITGRMDAGQVDKYEGTVIGYRDPGVKNSDQKREAACAAAFAKAKPELSYVEVK